MSDYKRILVIKLRAIGDVVMATPVVENLRHNFPDSHIAFLTEPASREALEGNPFLDEIIVQDRNAWQRLPYIRRLKAQWDFYRQLRSREFDLVFDLFGNPRSAILTLISGARRRVGFDFRFRRYCYDTVVRPRGGEVHEVLFNLDALHALNMNITTTSPLFPLEDRDKTNAGEWLDGQGLKENDLLVGLNPGGGWEIKRWKPEGYASIADRLIANHSAKVILLWGPGERERIEQVIEIMEEKPYILPQTTLRELAAFITHCNLILSNDSGPMHIAAALQVPTIGIFGPTNPLLQGPYGTGNTTVCKEGLECLSCNRVTCDIGNVCMTTLTPDEVFDVMAPYLNPS